ncbi:hypothetical protein GCM10022226_46280 [Sphaerisporangium flaviroseum]|uniref:Lipoprotein n=1 Tax=Sphaerisporangium flaviroseum TaxID=509199 RepID=A0ABP7IKA2_9ACTN
MKTLSRKLVAATAAAAAVFLSACSAEPHTIVYHADYPSYQTADQLYQKATLVIEARLGSTAQVVQEKANPAAQGTDEKSNPQAGVPQGQAAPPEQQPVVTTVYPVEVVKVFKGSAKPGENIQVKELGGTVNGVTYKEPGSRPLEKGKTYVLFLETYPDSPASLLNPEQGKYPIDAAGNLAPLAENPVKLTRPDLDNLSAND